MKIAGLKDAAAREAIRSDLDRTLVVEAAAGTGKTTELVQRMVHVVESGRGSMESVVAVTFTEKAAGELKLRLRSELEAARRGAAPRQRERLERAIVELEAARIGTIHGFCHDLLRERPVEAAVDPGFQVLDEGAARKLFARVFDGWLQEQLDAPPEGLRRFLRRASTKASGVSASLRRAAYRLVETRDFDAPYRRDPFDRQATIDTVLAALAALTPLAERAHNPRDVLAQSLQELARFERSVRRREQVASRDYDGLEHELRALLYGPGFKRRGGQKLYGTDLLRSDVLSSRDALRAQIERCLEQCDADLAACLHSELWPLVERYEQAKATLGALDFFDLLLCTRALLREHGGVRRELRERFTHLFLDEFQDTDPVQTEIVLLLGCADDSAPDPWACVPKPGKLFVVGDPKQSIYRFRRADQRFYERVKRHLQRHGAAVVHLSTSFRSSPCIQSLVNASFEPVMRGDLERGQSGYVPLEPFRAVRDDQPAVVALPVPEPYGSWGRVTNFAIDASLPQAVGAWVHWLLHESGWTVEESGAQVPVAPRHVCLLFRRTAAFGRDVVHPYVRALEARHIHHVRGGGRSFFEREEVMAMRAALSAIEWPDDELSVYATMRGPLFALSDDVLLQLKAEVGSLHPLKPYELDSLPPALQEAAQALELLGRLHAARNRRPVQQTLSLLLAETRAHAAIAIWPTGEQALGNVLRLCDLARRYESEPQASSFRGFVEWLEEQAQEGESAEAAVIEEGDDGVRIMTVHGAKGLEFPVVVLCDPTAPRRPQRPSRFVDDDARLWAQPIVGLAPAELNDHRESVLDEDEAEEQRLAYVATTRARDVLVVPVVGDRTVSDAGREGWLEVLWPALYPAHEDRRNAQTAPRCPRFGDDSVLVRPERAERTGLASVAPGLHRPEEGAHAVVFWDPETLDLRARPVGGLRQQELLKDDGAQGVANTRIEHFEAWRSQWHDTREQASAPSTWAAPVTTLAAQRDSEPRPLRIERCERAPDRPRGARFGSLVHALLEHVSPGEPDDEVQALARSLGRSLGASEEEQQAACVAVGRALAHPVLVRAHGAAEQGALYREAPLTVVDERGNVTEGIVDLAFHDGGQWWIVDYKTDAAGELNPQYAQQLTLYAEALEGITGQPAHCVLLLV